MTLDNRETDGGVEPSSLPGNEIALVIHAALLAAWITCLIWLSLASHPPVVPRLLAWDKLHHALAYAILMLLSGRFFSLLWRRTLHGWVSGFVFSLAFGLLMEIAQGTLTTNRYADYQDLIANAIGAGLVFAIALIRQRIRS